MGNATLPHGRTLWRRYGWRLSGGSRRSNGYVLLRSIHELVIAAKTVHSKEIFAAIADAPPSRRVKAHTKTGGLQVRTEGYVHAVGARRENPANRLATPNQIDLPQQVTAENVVSKLGCLSLKLFQLAGRQ